MGGTPHSKEVSLQQELRLLGRLVRPRVVFWAAGGKEVCFVEDLFFSEQHIHLACSQKQQKVTVVSAAFL